MKRIITDIDNSVVNFASHFEDWAVSAGHNIKRGIINNTYDFKDMFDHDIDVEEFFKPFFACDTTMSTFPALPHSVESIRRLHALGYEFVAITACDPRKGLQELRHENLKNLFGFDFEEVHITGFDGSKGEVLKRFDPTYWIEDNTLHAQEGARLGHTTFLIDYPYNQGEGDFIRVKDWREIEERICMDA